MFSLKIRFLIAALLIVALNTVLVLSQKPAPAYAPISCVITLSDGEGHRAVCQGRNPNPICEGRNEPECNPGWVLTWDKGTWPREWAGSRSLGAVYRIRWSNGEHKPLPSATRCQELYEQRRRAHRAGINDGIRNPNYFIPEDCEGLITQ